MGRARGRRRCSSRQRELLARICRNNLALLRLKEWKDTQRIAVGGGFRESRIGELVTGRTAVILKGDRIDLDLVPIHNHLTRLDYWAPRLKLLEENDETAS